jgi:hypothetical protein
MKIIAPVPIPVAYSRAFRQPRSAQVKITSTRDVRRRVRRLIESSGQVERYLCSRWVDTACIGAIVVSVLYFFPLLMPRLMG